MGEDETPPGTAAARERGCICPVDDNNHGAGWKLPDGQTTWDVTYGCPLHWPKERGPS